MNRFADIRRQTNGFAASYLNIISLVILLFTFNTAVAADPEPQPGQHDVLLLLPQGPLHLRIHVTHDGKPLEDLRHAYTQTLVAQLDVDQDGKLDRDETTKHPLFVSGRRFTGNKFLNSLRAKKPYTDDEIKLAVDRAAGQLVTFRQNDALVDQDLSVFKALDADESGLVERIEMRTAAARIADRDQDFDQCITFDEFLDQPDATGMNAQVVSPVNDEPPPNILSEVMRNAAEPIMGPRLIRKYDQDRDAHLSAVELHWSEDRVAELDSSKDQRLSVQELSRLRHGQPDIELQVDFADQPAGGNMTLVGIRDSVNLEQEREDVFNIDTGEITMRIGYRHRDPIAESEANARNAFNAIDTDANGYLDREEIIDRQRFERYLFDAMDKDGDDRVFAEEMLGYVNAYTEPASTSCQMTMFDMGSGYFQMLDKNADGRISIRELRRIEDSLLQARNDGDTINPSRATKSFRIEIQRGGVSLFGRVDRPEAETPAALLKPPTGPIWFQRMDRNADGDLTWDEFLGPRQVFHELDKDQDDLIDQTEAEAAG